MKHTKRVVATLMATFLIGGLMAVVAAPASAGICEEKSPFTDTERRAAGLDEICGEPIVFSDAKTGDLFLTDDEGNGPVRLTNTNAIEQNPAGLFPWVFYDATTKDGSDIYMMSLLDPGHARIRITGLHSEDWDPTAVSMYMNGGTPQSEVGDRAMAKGPGGLFYPILLAYSSDRDANNNKCGIEIFAELVTITGPERMTACDKSDKLDPEWAGDGAPWFAYEAWKWNSAPPQIRVSDGLILGDEDFSVLANGMYPTWSPFYEDDAPDRDPSQPAGYENVTYTNQDGDLWSVFIDGSGNDFLLAPDTANQRFGESEWDTWGNQLVINVYTPTKSWLVLGGKGVSPPITSKKKYAVQSMDFVSIPFL